VLTPFRIDNMTQQTFKRLSVAFALIGAFLLACGEQAVSEGQKVRPPGVAGQFYPADPKVLAATVDGFLARAVVERPSGTVLGLVCPHAGYEFSGQVAAYSYSLLKGRKIARVVVISPCHVDAFPYSSVYAEDAYSTPLGIVPVDKEFARRLAALNSLIQLSNRGHGEVQGRSEHSLEVQLPFLQRTLAQFKLVPIVMGSQTYDDSRALGVSLAKLLQGGKQGPPAEPDTVIVASSDLSHYHPYDEAVRLDHATLTALAEYDYFNMSQNFERRVWEACGGGPIVAAMIAAERLGANQAIILKYANSGDVTGDKSQVVGYGAAALVAAKPAPKQKAAAFSLSGAEKDELLRIAKKSVETVVKERKVYGVTAPRFEALQHDRGAFVTLKEKGQLRGCIGYIAPMKPLYLTVRDVAAAAAVEDPRFQRVSVAELGQLEYEISVLSPLRRVTDIKQIRVGQHGLVIREGQYEGLLLPQVPTEQGWDKKTFLEETCVKAGLPRQAWQDEDADLFMFSALVFGEHVPPEPPNLEELSPRRPQEQPGLPGQDLPRP
jgi:AmmeMemoRadiSam system protein B/AmmeMemoRadiSam system protein A